MAKSTARTESAPSMIADFNAAVSGSSRSAKKRAVAMRSVADAVVSEIEAMEGQIKTTGVVPLDPVTRAAVEEGLAQARRGEFVPDEEVAKADARLGLKHL